MRWRKITLLGAVLTVSLAHYLTPVGDHSDHSFHAHHAVYRWFFHLPIILAGLWFGLRGGVGLAVVVLFLYLPHVLFQWDGGTTEQWLEMGLYLGVGFVTGLVSERQKRERDRYRDAAQHLDRAYDELKEKTRILLDTEEQLRRADRLSVLGELSAGMAHEIRTPLASIRGAAELLAGPTVDEKERAEFSAILVRETDRLGRVVNRFLEFASSPPGAPPACDLGEALEEVGQLVGVEARRHDVFLSVRIPEGLPAIRIDASQLRQVVLNLAMNSLQAMESGGELSLTAERHGAGVRLRVGDTGAGIPDHLRDRLFEPFVTGRPDGTGLGLSIVFRILENHGATIAIRDREGGGTEVEVEFGVEESSDG